MTSKCHSLFVTVLKGRLALFREALMWLSTELYYHWLSQIRFRNLGKMLYATLPLLSKTARFHSEIYHTICNIHCHGGGWLPILLSGIFPRWHYQALYARFCRCRFEIPHTCCFCLNQIIHLRHTFGNSVMSSVRHQ